MISRRRQRGSRIDANEPDYPSFDHETVSTSARRQERVWRAQRLQAKICAIAPTTGGQRPHVPDQSEIRVALDRYALNAKIALQNLRSRFDLAGRPFVGDMAVIDDVCTLRQRQRGSEILLHQDDGLSGVGHAASSSTNFASGMWLLMYSFASGGVAGSCLPAMTSVGALIFGNRGRWSISRTASPQAM
jgi:hypothetical protein